MVGTFLTENPEKITNSVEILLRNDFKRLILFYLAIKEQPKKVTNMVGTFLLELPMVALKNKLIEIQGVIL
ncbi:hypothetical protein [Emticicia sp. BO119]|uniref:hypothetical protein n=1 Tax=Emticicia sp. BO119 TaxID=2757768 RepID=UPI0015F10095|nr:hypothetical protein [Emticicia sp. BO119]MBA4849583.1 hypothetical protein [Emticicia sp. BO119]